MTDLTNRQILNAMRDALEETARKLANGEINRSGTLSVAKLPSRVTFTPEHEAATKRSSQN